MVGQKKTTKKSTSTKLENERKQAKKSETASHRSKSTTPTIVIQNGQSTSVSKPLKKPSEPLFELKDSDTDEYRALFWKKYPKIVNNYNIRATLYRRNLNWNRKYFPEPGKTDGHGYDSSKLNDTSWHTTAINTIRTSFETTALKINVCVYPEWYRPSFMDLSGPIGTVNYCRLAGDKNLLKFLGEGRYKFGDIEFKLSFFNYLERNDEYYQVLSSGYRIRISSKLVEDDTYNVIAEPYNEENLRVVIRFHHIDYEWPEHILTFLVPGTVQPSRVNTYPYNDEKGSLEFITDIPFTTKVQTFCRSKPSIDGSYDMIAEIYVGGTISKTPLSASCDHLLLPKLLQ